MAAQLSGLGSLRKTIGVSCLLSSASSRSASTLRLTCSRSDLNPYATGFFQRTEAPAWVPLARQWPVAKARV
jgi:hypothetical protein